LGAGTHNAIQELACGSAEVHPEVERDEVPLLALRLMQEVCEVEQTAAQAIQLTHDYSGRLTFLQREQCCSQGGPTCERLAARSRVLEDVH